MIRREPTHPGRARRLHPDRIARSLVYTLPVAEHTREYLEGAFRHFITVCEGRCPLYIALSASIADDDDLLHIASHSQHRQPPVNMLYAAAHFLLLNGFDHPLAAYYRSLGGTKPATDAWPHFRDFCIEHRDAMIPLITDRRVQTNEVGRCAMLLPALARVYETFGRPLHLIEVGASAGLNLFFDRYRYDYGNGRVIGPDSPVVMRSEVRGEHPVVIPGNLPPVADRTGIDIAPVDVNDDDAMRWVEALIWPDELDRIELHRGARQIARAAPPTMLTGDGIDIVPAVLNEMDSDVTPCVYHSHAIYQMSSDWRDAFHQRLAEISRARDLAHISLEWLDPDPCPQLHLSTWRNGDRQRTHLASCDHHGRWIEPLA